MVYSFNPQVHAFDDLSVMETLEAQVPLVESARRFATALFVRPDHAATSFHSERQRIG
jgi:hypothetical protein